MSIRKICLLALCALLALCPLTGCQAQEEAAAPPAPSASAAQQQDAQESAQPWEEMGVSEDFYAVTEDFAARFLTADGDGQRFDHVLDAVEGYLQGELAQDEAEAELQRALDACQQALDSAETVVLDQALVQQLRNCGISPEEYEAFANSRTLDLQTQKSSIATLLFYLQNAQGSDNARENLDFFHSAHARMQESMRAYYYYGCFNYWFVSADDAERARLQEAVVSRLEAYLPADPVWYGDAEEVEARVMLSLDEVEAVQNELALHTGQEQSDLYEMEKDYNDLVQQEQELQALEEKLAQLKDIGSRIEALSEQIEQASQNGDEALLAQLKVEFEALVAEYEALVGES